MTKGPNTKTRAIFVILSIFSLSCFNLHAQEQTHQPASQPSSVPTQLEAITKPIATASGVPVKLSKKERTIELQEMQVDLARNLYGITPSLENKIRLASAYEDYLSNICRGYILKRTSNNPKCAEYAQTLVSIDPASPIGTCAYNGVSSKSCAESYNKVEIRELGSNELAQLERSQQTPKGYQENLSKVIMQIQKAKLDHQRQRNEQSLQDLISSYDQLLPLVCKRSVFRTEGTQELRRVRYISSQCIQAAKEVMELDPRNAQALCYTQGFASPRCLKAQNQKLNQTEKSTPKKETDEKGFVSFQ